MHCPGITLNTVPTSPPTFAPALGTPPAPLPCLPTLSSCSAAPAAHPLTVLIAANGKGIDLATSSDATRWLVSVYFALTTVATIGGCGCSWDCGRGETVAGSAAGQAAEQAYRAAGSARRGSALQAVPMPSASCNQDAKRPATSFPRRWGAGYGDITPVRCSRAGGSVHAPLLPPPLQLRQRFGSVCLPGSPLRVFSSSTGAAQVLARRTPPGTRL